ncbi:MAG: hypothetical protein IAE87_06355, partial [Rhodobacteraceae bacterium]|nr:hypothetical protein [Paracoccaceae bacterium]
MMFPQADAVFDDDSHAAAVFDADLLARYSVRSYRSATAVLRQRAPQELAALQQVLRAFTISQTEIRSPGGNRMSATERFGDLATAAGGTDLGLRDGEGAQH